MLVLQALEILLVLQHHPLAALHLFLPLGGGQRRLLLLARDVAGMSFRIDRRRVRRRQRPGLAVWA